MDVLQPFEEIRIFWQEQTRLAADWQWELQQVYCASAMVTCHALSALSNSFLNAEPLVLRFLLSVAITVMFLRRALLMPDPQRRARAVALAFAMLLRYAERLPVTHTNTRRPTNSLTHSSCCSQGRGNDLYLG